MITVKSKPKELIPAGTYIARAFSMIHIGEILVDYKGDKKWQNIIQVTWELPTELKVFSQDKGEQPCVISQEYTLFLKSDKSKLRKMLESWRGKPFTSDELNCFDVTKLIGVPCTLSIAHKISESGNEYQYVSSVSPLMKGIVCPPQINASYEFSYEPFDVDKFNKLSEWLQNKIKLSKEYKAATSTGNPQSVNQETEYTSSPEEIEELPF